ncbi:enoyl-CoA hydratase/isomerase family protein [Burkholderia sp. MR1-5-21]
MNGKITLASNDDIALITMHGDARANAIDLAFCDEMLRIIGDIERAGKYRAVILRATGRIFSAGGDLGQIHDSLCRSDSVLESLIGALHDVVLSIRRLPMPVIASVQGAAAGAGFSLALACDLVIASRAARFVVGYAKLGTSSDGGLSFHLARRLGTANALHVLLVKDSLSAEEANALGLVQHVTDASSLDGDSLAMARAIAGIPESAVAELKSMVGSASSEADLERHLEREKQAFLRCAATRDFRQRVADFVGRSSLPGNPST